MLLNKTPFSSKYVDNLQSVYSASLSEAQLPEEKSGQVCWKSYQYRQVGMCHLKLEIIQLLNNLFS